MAARGSLLACTAAALAALFIAAVPALGQGRNGTYQEHYESVPPDTATDRESGRTGNANGDWARDGTFIGNSDNDGASGGDDGEDVADVAYFRAELTAEGKWVRHPRYGAVWRPDVATGWRPYTLGRWAYSNDYGWTWISDEPFGWAVYHYGRWGYERQMGWFWRPGTEWAPAWVAWRQGDDVVGWAPLPPAARFVQGRMTFNTALLDGEDYEPLWVFVRPRHLVRPDLRRFLRPRSWNAELMVRSQPRVAYERASDRKWRRVVNRGLSPQIIERLSNRPVPRLRIVPVDEPSLKRADHFARWRAREMREVKIYRPDRLRTERVLSKHGGDAGETNGRDRGDGTGSTMSRTGELPAATSTPPAETYTYTAPPPSTTSPRRDWTTAGTPRVPGTYPLPGEPERQSAAQSGDVPSGTIPVRPSLSSKRWDRSGPSGAPTLGPGDNDAQD